MVFLSVGIAAQDALLDHGYSSTRGFAQKLPVGVTPVGCLCADLSTRAEPGLDKLEIEGYRVWNVGSRDCAGDQAWDHPA